MIIILVILLIIAISWGVIVILVKNGAKSILEKYSESSSWIESNNTVKIIRKILELYENGIIMEEDAIKCKLIISGFKVSVVSLLILFIIAILAKVLLCFNSF